MIINFPDFNSKVIIFPALILNLLSICFLKLFIHSNLSVKKPPSDIHHFDLDKPSIPPKYLFSQMSILRSNHIIEAFATFLIQIIETAANFYFFNHLNPIILILISVINLSILLLDLYHD